MSLQLSASQLVQQASPTPAPAVGPAAIAFNLQTFDGKSITLETFRGKPLVLNFFASWCDPCRDEMPLINDLAARELRKVQRARHRGRRHPRRGHEFGKEAKLVFPIALDLNSTVKRAYRIFGPPATFFIDGQGVIRDMVLGPISAERAADALKKLNCCQKISRVFFLTVLARISCEK